MNDSNHLCLNLVFSGNFLQLMKLRGLKNVAAVSRCSGWRNGFPNLDGHFRRLSKTSHRSVMVSGVNHTEPDKKRKSRKSESDFAEATWSPCNFRFSVETQLGHYGLVTI